MLLSNNVDIIMRYSWTELCADIALDKYCRYFFLSDGTIIRHAALRKNWIYVLSLYPP